MLQTISAVICAVCGFLWGTPDGLLYALIAFMILDYITGLISAYIRKEISSSTGFRGIAKKVFIMVLVAVGHVLDSKIIGDGTVCRSAVIGFYLANEGISILENSGKIGLPVPEKLLNVLEQIKNKEKKQ
ncbi:MAG: phage holin family protein [Ruminococcus flavefaciens]|nr:phage holin family protein [Ruminococcus flavefaciens]